VASLALRPGLLPIRLRLSLQIWVAPLLLAAALALRWPHFADPAYALDEQFYLVMGDGLLHGTLPYVDAWDRKPIGLFLIYAAVRLLGGDGVLQYHMVAAGFAAATAWVIARIAARAASPAGGIAAGLLYLLWIETMEGGGGQSPVFYNLFMAGAAAFVLRAVRSDADRDLARNGFAAMALAGLAIQIKYTAVLEALLFGLVLTALAWQRLPRARAFALVAALAVTALAPTLLAFSAYLIVGQVEAFWFANFVSIFRRGASDVGDYQARSREIWLHILPMGVCAAASWWQLARRREPALRLWLWFLAGWLTAALAGCWAIGTMLVHYVLPVFVPLAIAAVPIVRAGAVGWALVAVAAWLPASHLRYPDLAPAVEHRRQLTALEALVPADVKTGCMQMLGGPPILYLRTRACTVSRFIFPNHLVASTEAPALGVDAPAELDRVLSRRPLVLVTDPSLPPMRLNRIERSYRIAGVVLVDDQPVTVWHARPSR
jgi:hypothetical protein